MLKHSSSTSIAHCVGGALHALSSKNFIRVYPHFAVNTREHIYNIRAHKNEISIKKKKKRKGNKSKN